MLIMYSINSKIARPLLFQARIRYEQHVETVDVDHSPDCSTHLSYNCVAAFRQNVGTILLYNCVYDNVVSSSVSAHVPTGSLKIMIVNIRLYLVVFC